MRGSSKHQCQPKRVLEDFVIRIQKGFITRFHRYILLRQTTGIGISLLVLATRHPFSILKMLQEYWMQKKSQVI